MTPDPANGGPEPSAEILRAIRHVVAARACEVAARETRSADWAGMVADQRERARSRLHQAASAPRALMAFNDRRLASARDERNS